MATVHPVAPDPYRAPTASLRPPTIDDPISEAEAIRRIYLGHEAAVRSLGSLSYLVAAIAVIALLVFGQAALGLSDIGGPEAGPMAGVAATFVVISGGMGYGLTHLQAWARWVTIVVAGLACFRATFLVLGAALALATSPLPLVFTLTPFLIIIYTLYLMLSAKGAMVFSGAYREVVRQTPQMAYRTSRGLKVALAVCALIVVAAFVAVLSR